MCLFLVAQVLLIFNQSNHRELPEAIFIGRCSRRQLRQKLDIIFIFKVCTVEVCTCVGTCVGESEHFRRSQLQVGTVLFVVKIMVGSCDRRREAPSLLFALVGQQIPFCPWAHFHPEIPVGPAPLWPPRRP